MRVRFGIDRGFGWAWLCGGLLALSAQGSMAQEAREPLLQATPLILKDGRIANVSVHVVPFTSGQAEIEAPTISRLAAFTRTIATDCFLTAQVIGHIGAAEFGPDETLDAHRLARARADAIQASLIDGGLPAKAIASVWDWQFLVRESRATLWVFRLTAGEDCDGTPLRPGLVAETAVPGATATDRRAEPAPPMTQASAPASAPTPPPAASAPTAAAAAPAAAVVAMPAGPAPSAATMRTEIPEVTQPLPAMSPAPAASPATPAPPAAPDTQVAALPVEAPVPVPTPRRPEAGAAAVDPVTITFATNSSYFPPGAGQSLGRMIAKLPDDGRYQVRVRVSVSGSNKVIGAKSEDEAKKYNRWLAERRLDRVKGWLSQHQGDRELVLVPEFATNDDSRRLRVEVGPQG